MTTDVVCRHVAVCRQRPHCVAGASLFWMVVGVGGVVDGGGGKEEAAWQCLSHACRIWEDRCRGWDLFSFCFMYNKAFVAQVA